MYEKRSVSRAFNCIYRLTACYLKIGLEVKTKPAEELTEIVEITEDVDEEAEIQNEVWP